MTAWPTTAGEPGGATIDVRRLRGYGRPGPTVDTRYDARLACVNCGHREFVVLERGDRDAAGTKTGVDVEACERCYRIRHV